MTHDLVIRNGLIVDGTGAPPYPADVAVRGDRIAEVGEVGGRGHREIDADGRYVTPGFVDIHTHLDAQVAWDPLLTSSCWHGVTSVVMGNCGVTFAPVGPDDHAYLAEMMESVEDIPRSAILEGLPWTWETFGQYLDTLDGMEKGLNVGGLVGHCAVRYRAMGERSLDQITPDAEDLAAMSDLVDEAIAAGALGFSTSRTRRHVVPDGRHVPGTWAELAELQGICAALGRHGRGVIEIAPRFDGEGPSLPRAEAELALMRELSRGSGRPLTFNLTHTHENPDHHERVLEMVRDANGAGAELRPQTTSRGIGVLFSLAHATPFDGVGAWAALADRSVEQKLAVFADPDQRARLVRAADEEGPPAEVLRSFHAITGEQGARYDCRPEDSLAARAQRRGVSPAEAYLQLALETDGRVIVNWPVLNQSLDAIATMLEDPVTLMGLADAGAHVGQILDASQPTFFLSYWVRERGLLPLEEGIRRLTSDTAGFMGLAHRGQVRAGAYADLNVIDFDHLNLPLPVYEHDFPGGAGRYLQRSHGFDLTLVNGEVLMEAGEHTGSFPGRVLRSGPDLR